MEPIAMKLPRIAKNAAIALLGALIIGGGLAANMAAWAARGTIVIFNANWCASCREVVPIVREIAGQNTIPVTIIDIDYKDAPRQAHTYGLSIPTGDPPQVFYVDRGNTVIIYSGQGYKYGYTDAVRSTILQNLQRALGSEASGS